MSGWDKWDYTQRNSIVELTWTEVKREYWHWGINLWQRCHSYRVKRGLSTRSEYVGLPYEGGIQYLFPWAAGLFSHSCYDSLALIAELKPAGPQGRAWKTHLATEGLRL